MRQFVLSFLTSVLVLGLFVGFLYFESFTSNRQAETDMPQSEMPAMTTDIVSESPNTLAGELANIPVPVMETSTTATPVPETNPIPESPAPQTPNTVEEEATNPLFAPLSDPQRYWEEIDRHFEEYVRGRRARPSPLSQPGQPAGGTSSTQPISRNQLEQQVVEAARRYGVPAQLALALVRVESNFNPKAISRAGALGLMQVLPATASRIGCQPRLLKDVQHNLRCGMNHLRDLLDQYGDERHALAAYYAGHVLKASLPPETREDIVRYVRSVLRARNDYERMSYAF